MTAKRHGKQASNPGDAQAAARHIASGRRLDGLGTWAAMINPWLTACDDPNVDGLEA